MNIYELTEEFLRLQMWLEEEGSEEDEALKETLEMVSQDFEDKADGYGMVIKNMEARSAALKLQADLHKAEAKRYLEQSAFEDRQIERVKEKLRNALELTGKKNLKTEKFCFGTRTSSSIVVDAENVFEIPDDCLRYKDPEPDKAAIKEWIKNHPDEEITWAHVETKTSLTIK